ncbi:MAG: NADH-quinone oxidoreductase subunit L [Pyrinomonadaceae bacterium]
MLRLIIFAPLVGALINWLVGRRLKSEFFSGLVACAAVAVSAVVAFWAAFSAGALTGVVDGHPVVVMDHLWTWIQVGSFRADFGLAMDRLSGIYACFITFVGLLIHVFATGYMHGDKGFPRFFAYLNLFMFSMLTLILADNMLLMFVGWEGVGLCSYLLIGYYTKKPEAGSAAKKAFVANRIGDWGVVLGIMLTFVVTGSISFFDKTLPGGVHVVSALNEIGKHAADPFTWGALIAGGVSSIAILLFIGATGKSAQIPLFVWLPDAMAGPTPVSALIHAATMVTAGVYLVVRCNVIYQLSPTVMFIVAIIGAATAILAATIGLAQNDIKKVLAYSTVSQLGYMFLACGVGAFVAAIFHVMTHAFFKALLFLGSGSVIHGMHHEQDMRRMGNLRKYMPITFATMFIGWLAICGIAPWAGFFSKDEILWKTFSTGFIPYGKILWSVGAFTALLTAIYMTRMMVMTFGGKERFNDPLPELAHSGGGHDEHTDVVVASHDDVHADDHAVASHDAIDDGDDDEEVEHHHHGPLHPKESPWSMTIPLIVLAILSTVGGLVGVPHALSSFVGINVPNVFERTLEPIIAHPGEMKEAAEARAEAKGMATEKPAAGHATEKTPAPSHGTEPAASSTVKSEKPAAEHEPSAEESALEVKFTALSLGIAILGIFLGWLMFKSRPLRPMPSLFENKWYVDELYDATLINPIHWFSREFLWKMIDQGVIDGLINEFARGLVEVGEVLRRVQVGFVRSYAAIILVGAIIVIGVFIYFGTALAATVTH